MLCLQLPKVQAEEEASEKGIRNWRHSHMCLASKWYLETSSFHHDFVSQTILTLFQPQRTGRPVLSCGSLLQFHRQKFQPKEQWGTGVGIQHKKTRRSEESNRLNLHNHQTKNSLDGGFNPSKNLLVKLDHLPR